MLQNCKSIITRINLCQYYLNTIKALYTYRNTLQPTVLYTVYLILLLKLHLPSFVTSHKKSTKYNDNSSNIVSPYKAVIANMLANNYMLLYPPDTEQHYFKANCTRATASNSTVGTLQTQHSQVQNKNKKTTLFLSLFWAPLAPKKKFLSLTMFNYMNKPLSNVVISCGRLAYGLSYCAAVQPKQSPPDLHNGTGCGHY